MFWYMIRQSIPSALSIMRIAIAFIMPIAYHSRYTVVLFVIACITDFLDGLLARMWGAMSSIGALLDQVADKFFVFFMMLTLTYHGRLPIWFGVAIVSREVLVSLAFIKLSRRGCLMQTNIIGKFHIFMQFSILFFSMWYVIPNLVLYVATVLSIAPIVLYTNQIEK